MYQRFKKAFDTIFRAWIKVVSGKSKGCSDAT